MNTYRATPGMALPVDGYLFPSDAPGFGIEITLEGIESATYTLDLDRNPPTGPGGRLIRSLSGIMFGESRWTHPSDSGP